MMYASPSFLMTSPLMVWGDTTGDETVASCGSVAHASPPVVNKAASKMYVIGLFMTVPPWIMVAATLRVFARSRSSIVNQLAGEVDSTNCARIEGKCPTIRRNWREQALPESVRRDAVLLEGAHLREMNIRGYGNPDITRSLIVISWR